jgi:DNA-nicking Smr family endonuclease
MFWHLLFDVTHAFVIMKKRKKKEQSPPDFKNNPFRLLKGIATRSGSAGESTRTQVTRRKGGITPEEERALFLRAAEGARRIGHGQESTAPAADQQKRERKGHREGEESQLFLLAMQKIGANITDAVREPEMDDAEHRSTTSRMRQLKRGTIRITRQLDLHGFVRDEALQRLSNFVVDAYNEGQKALLVITGKGINSPEGPVLQGAVDDWLRKQGRGMVAEFSSAPRTYGGKGAFVVFLKRNELK